MQRQQTKEQIVSSSGFIGGAIIGVPMSLYGRYDATAAVKVRPNLAGVGFIEATVPGHGTDWLFYQYPDAMSMFTILFAVVVLGIVWSLLRQ
jgi:hypothetical protein